MSKLFLAVVILSLVGFATFTFANSDNDSEDTGDKQEEIKKESTNNDYLIKQVEKVSESDDKNFEYIEHSLEKEFEKINEDSDADKDVDELSFEDEEKEDGGLEDDLNPPATASAKPTSKPTSLPEIETSKLEILGIISQINLLLEKLMKLLSF